MDLPDGTTVAVVVGGRLVAEAEVEAGRMRLDMTSSDGKVPEIQVGESIELQAGAVTHLIGKYRPD